MEYLCLFCISIVHKILFKSKFIPVTGLFQASVIHIMSSSVKYHENAFCSNSVSDELIRSKFCTCHDSQAVVTCAKFWPDLISTFHIITTHIFARFRLWPRELYEMAPCLQKTWAMTTVLGGNLIFSSNPFFTPNLDISSVSQTLPLTPPVTGHWVYNVNHHGQDDLDTILDVGQCFIEYGTHLITMHALSFLT